MTTANYEGNIIDGRTFKGGGAGGFGGVPEVAADAKAMGIRLVARSNNHAGEYGYEGLLETNSWLEKAGVVYAGSGEKYASARAARFVSTPKGRVGMVATASSYAQNMVAEPGRGEYPGRGGQSALRYTRFYMTPPALWQSVKNIREAFPNGNGFYVPAGDTNDLVTVLGERFKLAPNAAQPYYSYQMNQGDLRDLMAAVTEGKLRSDFMTFAIHAHQFADTKGGERGGDLPDTDDLDTNPSIADFLPVLAKAAIDAGADAFLGTGVHVLRGIEIYKGKPIFYGLGEFFRQMDVIGISGLGRARGDENSPPIKYESVVAVSRFEHGQLAEIRLHPLELHRRCADGASRVAADRVARRRAADPDAAAEAVGAARHDDHDREQRRRDSSAARRRRPPAAVTIARARRSGAMCSSVIVALGPRLCGRLRQRRSEPAADLPAERSDCLALTGDSVLHDSRPRGRRSDACAAIRSACGRATLGVHQSRNRAGSIASRRTRPTRVRGRGGRLAGHARPAAARSRVRSRCRWRTITRWRFGPGRPRARPPPRSTRRASAHAGAGKRSAEARAPIYVGEGTRRVASIAVTASALPESGRVASQPDIRGRPGVNRLGYTAHIHGRRPTFAALKQSVVQLDAGPPPGDTRTHDVRHADHARREDAGRLRR